MYLDKFFQAVCQINGVAYPVLGRNFYEEIISKIRPSFTALVQRKNHLKIAR